MKTLYPSSGILSLNEVRSWRPEQFGTRTISTCFLRSLNEVRSWRPEQCPVKTKLKKGNIMVSMKSGLGDRNNPPGTEKVATLLGWGLNEVRSWRPEQ